MNYLISLIESNFTQKDLYELLLLNWNDQETFKKRSKFSRISPSGITYKFQKASFESSETKDNISRSITNTLIYDMFYQMNSCPDSYVRKLAAYIIWIVTFNNSELQKEICKHFNFTPLGEIVIINQFPKNILSNFEIENLNSSKGKC